VGEWHPEDWRAEGFDCEHYYAFSIRCSHVDWDNWKATKIPGLGSLNFHNFFGKEGCSVKLFDDKDRCFVHLDFLSPGDREARGVGLSACKDGCQHHRQRAVSESSATTVSTMSDFSSEGESQWQSECFEFQSDDELEGLELIPDERRSLETSPRSVRASSLSL
jgi:hypothetical protein